jgi:ferredoxin
VSAENCNGCGRCVADCPYEAVRLTGRIAQVLAERCAACGICAGACPSATPFRSVAELVSGIDLPDFTVHDLRRKLQAVLPADEVLFSCEKSGAGGIALRCLAQLPPSFVEYALRQGARSVRAIGCRDGACKWRLGMELSAERFAGAREPHLRANVRATRLDDATTFALR